MLPDYMLKDKMFSDDTLNDEILFDCTLQDRKQVFRNRIGEITWFVVYVSWCIFKLVACIGYIGL